MKTKILLVLLCLLLCAGCEKSQQPEKAQDEAPVLPQSDLETLPRMSGEYILQPLSEALLQYMNGLTPEQAAKQVQHTSQKQAVSDLQNGVCDVLFVGPAVQPLDGIEMVPVAKEALVFLTGQDNSVSDLSSDQLRSVYTGSLTNWSDLGGTPGAIMACRQPDNSASHALLCSLLVSPESLIQPPEELSVSATGELTVSAMQYRADAAALGYSLFYYENKEAPSGSKILSVDGVMPTAESIASGQYPLTCEYYAAFRAQEKEGSAVRQLVAWLLSDEGQELIQAAGYVPLRSME